MAFDFKLHMIRILAAGTIITVLHQARVEVFGQNVAVVRAIEEYLANWSRIGEDWK